MNVTQLAVYDSSTTNYPLALQFTVRITYMLQRMIIANLNLVRTMEFARITETVSLATVGGNSLERDARVSTG